MRILLDVNDDMLKNYGFFLIMTDNAVDLSEVFDLISRNIF